MVDPARGEPGVSGEAQAELEDRAPANT